MAMKSVLPKRRRQLTVNSLPPDKADAMKNLLMRRGLARSPMPMINEMDKRRRRKIIRD